jgi:beta-glucosidase
MRNRPSQTAFVRCGGALLIAALISACGRAPLGNDDVGSVRAESSALTAAALPRAGWVATASSSSSTLTPDKAIDGNAGTRWSSGVAQANGQWFQVDMVTPQTFVQLTLDATNSNNDYPRTYSVFVSNDGTNWGTAVATGSGTTALTTIVFPQQTARYVRIKQTGTATNWA